jgi:hypothetical protein
MLMSAENSPMSRERSGFNIVCIDCGSLSIKVADPVHAVDTTPVECARCGSIRGTLADLRGLALSGSDIFEVQSRENSK